jgi:transcription initiation factor IIE alpha subunit
MASSQVDNSSHPRLSAPRRGGKRSGAGRKGEPHRNAYLVLAIKAELRTIGAADDSPKVVTGMVRDIRRRDPTFCKALDEPSVVRTYFRYRYEPLPRGTSLLLAWGKSPKEAFELEERATAILDDEQIDELYDHVEHRRWRGKPKADWFENAIRRLERDPRDWPIPSTQRGRPDKQAGLVKAALHKGLTTKLEIADDTGIDLDSLQTLLTRMADSKEIDRVGHGKYAERTEGLVNYKRPDVDKEILSVLADGRATAQEMSTRTGIAEGSIRKGIGRLLDAKEITLIEPAGYRRGAAYELSRAR